MSFINFLSVEKVNIVFLKTKILKSKTTITRIKIDQDSLQIHHIPN